MTSFRDEPNPYDSPPIVATLVERPKTKIKRQPLLAIVFLIPLVPLVIGTTAASLGISVYWVSGMFDGRGDIVSGGLFAVPIAWIVTAFFWLATGICVREFRR